MSLDVPEFSNIFETPWFWEGHTEHHYENVCYGVRNKNHLCKKKKKLYKNWNLIQLRPTYKNLEFLRSG